MRNVFPKVLKLSFEVSECKPLVDGSAPGERRRVDTLHAAVRQLTNLLDALAEGTSKDSCGGVGPGSCCSCSPRRVMLFVTTHVTAPDNPAPAAPASAPIPRPHKHPSCTVAAAVETEAASVVAEAFGVAADVVDTVAVGVDTGLLSGHKGLRCGG